MKNVWSFDIDATPARVWEELTSTGKELPFYFGSVLEGDLRPGGNLRYVTPDRKHAFIEGKVLEFIPTKRFVHTFKFNDLREPPQTVSFDIETLQNGTRLTVRHQGLESAPKHGARVASGWPKIIGALKSWTETGTVPLGTRLQNAVMKLLVPLMPKGSSDAR